MKYLAQDLILLALNNQTGSIRFSTRSALPTTLIGAVLLDLVLRKLAIADKLIVVDASATGNDFLDQRLNEVLTAPRARTVKFWTGQWSRRHSGFKKAVLQNLSERL